MNRAYRIVPTPTGDVSGVASALYELGGMVVIHDPSGCNSTYNTHDEIRWYEKDSLIFISGLSQTDAIMGDDEKLIREIEEAARSLKPSFIALASSPIPYMNGTDFEAIARILEEDLGIPAFFVKTNGMHDYTYGVGNAFAMVAEKLLQAENREAKESKEVKESSEFKKAIEVKESKKAGAVASLNLLGVTPLDFAAEGSVEMLRKQVTDHGWKLQSCWAMGDSLEQIRTAICADVNLVVSAGGLKAAEVMEKRFGIPYVVGCPNGLFAERVFYELSKAKEEKKSRIAYHETTENQITDTPDCVIIGEPVTSISLAEAITREYGMKAEVVCPLEIPKELLRPCDRITDGEEELEAVLKELSASQEQLHVLCDPLYDPILPEGAILHRFPSLYVSGRCFRKEMKPMFLPSNAIPQLSKQKSNIELIDQLAKNQDLSDEEFLQLLGELTKEEEQYLYHKADLVRKEVYGNQVFLRGLIEFTNFCKNDCLYCGIRRGNACAERYRLTREQILSCCRTGYQLGFRTFVLQGGEDAWFTDERICELVRAIRAEFPDCAITLSIGEKEKESYQAYFDAGADRYLLRHETADEEHYSMLHPKELSGAHRKQCLADLKEIGYQVGCGIMVGSPYQTKEHILADFRYMQKLQPHMIGIGPFIPHKDTPFADQKAGTLTDTLHLLAIIRLMFPHVLLPATTALGTIHPMGREMGIQAGANVVMPNLSPADVRGKYLLYDGKICTGDEAAECRHCMERRMERIGYEVVVSRGDYKN